ncbi:MAG TPA: methyltransferase domain-containing protein [Solirubrobacteraceae bacterium]|jgi:2-polyprenyl-6-hydroxyphenyl methylase/3-demethylubiquinone-9 3-methyltransferase
MSARNYHETLWRALPEGLAPAGFELRRSFLLDRVQPGERVLDVGSGEGLFASALRGAGARVLAADVAEEPLRRAQRRDPALEVALIGAEGGWELPDAAFDVVWAGEVIEHVADTAAWLSELRRVLRSGGRLLLSTPSLGRAQLLAAALSRRAFAARFEPRSDHLRFYSRDTLAALICEFGFEQVSVRGAGGPPWAHRWLLASAVRSRF